MAQLAAAACRRVPSSSSNLVAAVCRSLHGLPPQEEFTDAPDYPEVPKHTNQHEKEAFRLADFVKGLRTVEEKLWYLNKPKFFGWHSVVMDAEKLQYGSLGFIQNATCTSVVEGLPSCYDDEEASDRAAELTKKIAPRLQRYLSSRCLEQAGYLVPNDRVLGHEVGSMPPEEHYHGRIREEAQSAVRGIHRALHSQLRVELPWLREAQVDLGTRSEAFWFKSGFPPNRRMVYRRLTKQKAVKEHRFRLKTGEEYTDEMVHEKHDRAMQIVARGMVKVRSSKQITPFVDADDPLCKQRDQVPTYDYNVEQAGFPYFSQIGVNNPGYWTCSPAGHTALQFVSSHNFAEGERNVTARQPEHEKEYRQDVLVAKGILHSFGVLLPEACYLGYGPFNDPASPLAIQTVVTDGVRFKPCAFQLNKTALFVDTLRDGDADARNNVLWHGPEFELLSGGDINVEGLQQLVKLLIREPTLERSRECLTLADVKSDYNRKYFFEDFRRMQARAARGERPETFAWEKLYRIEHPKIWHMRGWRHRPWYQMWKMDFKGREHWHPEFKHWDHYMPDRIPKVERTVDSSLRHLKWDKDMKHLRRVRKVSAPVPDEDQTNIYHICQPTHDSHKYGTDRYK